MLRVLLQVLNLLLAIEHLPALNAENLSVGLCFYYFELGNKVFPFGGMNFEHLVEVYKLVIAMGFLF